MLKWLRQFDWDAIFGSALVLILVLWALPENANNVSEPTANQGPLNYVVGLLSSEGWTALFTGLLFVSTVLLWNVTRRSVEIADRASSEQSALTRESIDAAKKSSEYRLRAYVLMDNAKAVSDAFDQWFVELQFRNFGDTPAFEIQTKTEVLVGDTTGVINVLPFTSKAAVHPSSVLAPRHPFNSLIRVEALADGRSQSALLRAGQILFLIGRIDYRDAFGNARWTKYQLFCDLKESLAFATCAVGNDADR